jgi:glucose uptake protein GlcU
MSESSSTTSSLANGLALLFSSLPSLFDYFLWNRTITKIIILVIVIIAVVIAFLIGQVQAHHCYCW